MAIKSTTIVVNVTEHKGSETSWEEALALVEACYPGRAKDVFAFTGKKVLEAGENYIITEKEHKIVALFYHDGESKDDIAEKITLTALSPMTQFRLEQYTADKLQSLGVRRANSAGILETMFSVPACSLVLLQEL